jgi:branched-chain amino acid transport system ATP-binding protein
MPRSDGDERRLRADALEWLNRLDVGDVADRLPTTLPFAVQKRIALARALVSRPRLLLLDEPAGGLGAEDVDPLAELIKSLPGDTEAPCSVLLVEHHMDLVMRVCDQVLVLDFGRRIAIGSPDDVQANPEVAAAYLGVDVPTCRSSPRRSPRCSGRTARARPPCCARCPDSSRRRRAASGYAARTSPRFRSSNWCTAA